MRCGIIDPRKEVVLTKEPEGKPNWARGWVGEAQITRYDYNDVELQCDNDRPCFLFLSDSYYPGWRAWVDGKEEPIYQADAAFRALELQNPGHHVVKMSYYPFVILGSFFFSLLAWILILMGWIYRVQLNRWWESRFSKPEMAPVTPVEAKRTGRPQSQG